MNERHSEIMTLDPTDSDAFRRVLGIYPTGVAVLTTVDAEGRRHGLTVNSFTSLSLRPPLILWSQSVSSPSHSIFMAAEHFVVNILANDQVMVSRRFATSGIDKFAGMALTKGLHGLPLIEGCAAHLECVREAAFPGGDHTVFIGRVERMTGSSRPALAFAQGKYRHVSTHEALST